VIEVRRAAPGDADALGEVHAAAWEAAYVPLFDADFAARGIQDRRTRWHSRIGDGTLLLAALDGRILACPPCFRLRPGLGSPRSTASTATQTVGASGVAGALMTGTLDSLRADRVTPAHLWTLRDTPRSRRFYTTCGFVETGAVRTRDFGDGNPLAQVEYERRC
jgi:hypothetical protein